MKMTSYHKSSGSSLLVVVSTMSILMGVVAIVAHYTTTVSRSVQRTNTMEQALTAADATIETLFTNWRAICRFSSDHTVAHQFLPWGYSGPDRVATPDTSGRDELCQSGNEFHDQ